MTNSRRKGHQFERDVVKRLKCIDRAASRKLEYQGVDTGCDIETSLPFCIQCKHHGQLTYGKMRGALEQASGKLGRLPVAVVKKTGDVPLAIMRLDDWLALVKEVKKG